VPLNIKGDKNSRKVERKVKLMGGVEFEKGNSVPVKR
jgi:hypothetical protein